jgi:hypothetical protein|tara:strand:- start:1221 stop:1568 length:348 start_codon:yes stop_codon:yes gene_type:complete
MMKNGTHIFQHGLVLAAVLLFAIPLEVCYHSITSPHCCQNAERSIPCDSPLCECHRTTVFAAFFQISGQRIEQSDLSIAKSDVTELFGAYLQEDASSPPPTTALERCVLFSRLTL